jgi:4-hydroxybenzoate polyprenyltransferase
VRHRHLIGLSILVLGMALGAVSTAMVYAYGQQQEALLVRIGIPGAVLVALAIGALIVWGRSLENGPD